MKHLYIMYVWLFRKAYKTKKERIEIYKKMLIGLTTNMLYSDRGFCSVLHEVEPKDISWQDNLHLLPELYRYKPFWSMKNSFWFNLRSDGMEKRRNILKDIIKKYEDTLT